MTDLRQFLGHRQQAMALTQLRGALHAKHLGLPPPVDIADAGDHLAFAGHRIDHPAIACLKPEVAATAVALTVDGGRGVARAERLAERRPHREGVVGVNIEVGRPAEHLGEAVADTAGAPVSRTIPTCSGMAFTG